MELSDEGKLHEAAKALGSSWKMDTAFGSISLELVPERIGYGSRRGVPDEILHVEVKLHLWGQYVTLRAPILLEAETKSGLPGAMSDLRKYEERSVKRERSASDLIIPMVVIGTGFRRQKQQIQVVAEVEMVEVTPEAVPGFTP